MAVFDFFQHIIIDIIRRDDNGPIAVFFIEEIGHLLQQGLAPFKTLAVVVADEHVHRARFDVAIQFIDVEEAFMAFGVFRFFPGRQELLPFCGNRQCVDHLSFGVACMDAAAMEGDDRVGSIEVFIFQTAQFAAVDSIGKVGSKLLHIEQSRTAPRFFIRREADADHPVSDVRVLDEVFHSADDSRDARFIVGPEEGRPIRKKDVLAFVFQDFRKSLRRKDDAPCFVEDDILAVIISDPDGLDVLPRCIGTGIDMRNEADDRAFCPVGRQRGHDISVFIQGDIRQADCLQFLCQGLGKDQLSRCTRADGIIVFIGLGIKRNILQKTLYNVFRVYHSNHSPSLRIVNSILCRYRQFINRLT